MTRITPLWQQDGIYPAAWDRQLIGAIWPNGGAAGMTATVLAGSMTIQITAGSVVVPDLANPGAAFLCPSDAAEQLQIATAPPAGQNRIDVITVKPPPNDQTVGWTFNVVQGVPAATAVAPAVPAGEMAIWQILVRGGQPTLAAGDLVDRRRRGGLAAGVPDSYPRGFVGFWTSGTPTVGIGGAWTNQLVIVGFQAEARRIYKFYGYGLLSQGGAASANAQIRIAGTPANEYPSEAAFAISRSLPVGGNINGWGVLLYRGAAAATFNVGIQGFTSPGNANLGEGRIIVEDIGGY